MTGSCRTLIALLAFALPLSAWADDRLVRLYALPALVETGVLRYALPRFSLKTQVRVEIVQEDDPADMILGRNGRPLFQGAGQTWHMDVLSTQHSGTGRLADWLVSEVGQRTIFAYAPEGVALFTPPARRAVAPAGPNNDGDAALGLKVSQTKCGRCHKVDNTRRVAGIGSTPSFAVLRSLRDWEERFTAFYVLNPHPSFTIVTDVTPPFPEDRPPPIVPIELSQAQIDAVLAYVSGMQSADLGAPLQPN